MRNKKLFSGLFTLAAIVAAATAMHAASGGPSALASGNLPTAYFHPGVLYFKVGTTSSETTTLTNTSAAKLLIESLTLQGSRASDFRMTTTCGLSLAAGASCTVTLSLTLSNFTAAGESLGKLVEYDNSAAGHHQVLLQAR